MPVAIKAGTAKRTPARERSLAEPNNGGAHSEATQKADSFGFAPGALVGENNSVWAVGSIQPIRGNSLRMAISLTPKRRAISRLEVPPLFQRWIKPVRSRGRRRRPLG